MKLSLQEDWNLDLIAFLTRNGWKIKATEENYLTELKSPTGRYARIPLTDEFDDFYDQGMSLLQSLADTCGRSPFEIYSEAQLTKSDVITLRFPESDSDGIPLNVAEAAITAFVDSFQVMARSVSASSQSKMIQGKKAQLDSLLKHEAKFGHTLRGSFVFRIIINLPQPLALENPEEGAFTNLARKTTKGYGLAIEDSHRSIVTKSQPEPTQNSASFVAKLVDLSGGIGFTNRAEIKATYSRWGHPGPFKTDSEPHISITASDRPSLEEVQHSLTLQAEAPDCIVGFVYRLQSERKSNLPNVVTVKSLLSNGKVKNFELLLNPEQYETAIHAHHNLKDVRVKLSQKRGDNKFDALDFAINDSTLF